MYSVCILGSSDRHDAFSWRYQIKSQGGDIYQYRVASQGNCSGNVYN